MKIFYNPKDDMGPHLPVIKAIVKNMSPSVVLEIGVRNGISTSAIMEGMKESEEPGEYHGCDINDQVKLPQIYENSQLHIMPSDKLAQRWTKEIELLFIDGSHVYEQVKKDYLNFSKHLKVGGFMFFHDTCPPTERFKSESLCGSAYKVLNDLARDKRFEVVTLPYSFGLTICRRVK